MAGGFRVRTLVGHQRAQGRKAAALRRHLPFVCGLVALACAGPAPAPRFVSAEEGGVQRGELRSLEGTGFPLAQLRPGRSLAGYEGVWLRILDPFYRIPLEGLEEPGAAAAGYALPDGTVRRLGLVLKEAFEAELVESGGLRRAEERGGGVLEARIALVDIVIDHPLDSTSVSDAAMAGSLGAFTLVVDLYDSQSGERLARVAERRRIASPSSRPIQATSGDTIYETQRIVRGSARKVREFIEATAEID